MPRRICNAEPRLPFLLLFRELHDTFGDALPFAIALHPGIYPRVAAGKLFPVLILALFRRGAGDGGQVRRIDMNVHYVVHRFATCYGLVFYLLVLLGFGTM